MTDPQSFKPLVSVIILNWNGLHHLKNYLPSVAASQYPNLEIILADNNSDDESVAFVSENYPDIRIIRHDQNYGYCKGNNLAAKKANGELIVFLNNDVRVKPDWLEHLTDLFYKYPGLAAAQPKLLSDRNPEYFDYAGAAGGLLDHLGYPWCRGRVFDSVEKDNGQYDAYPSRIFWASGAAFCVRADLFEKAGGFDESFMLHMEEIDLCWRLQRMGYEIRVEPASVVYHYGGGTLSMDTPAKVYFNFRNSLAMLAKNVRSGSLLPVLITRLALDAVAGLRFLLTGNWASHKAVWKACKDFYVNLPYWLKVRGDLERASEPDRLHGFGPKSIVWDYYVTGRRKVENSMPFSIVLLTFFSATRSDRGGKEL